jgi:hypothetical protein
MDKSSAPQEHFYLDENQIKSEAMWRRIQKVANDHKFIPKVHVDRAELERATIEQYLKTRVT